MQDHSPCSGEARSMKYKIYFDLESECTYGREEEAKNKNERQKKGEKSDDNPGKSIILVMNIPDKKMSHNQNCNVSL